MMLKRILLLFFVMQMSFFTTQAIAEEPQNIDLVSSQQQTVSNYIQKGYEDVLSSYNKMIIGYNTQNMDLVLDTIADRDDIVFFGSGNRYLLLGKDSVKEAFKKDFDNITNLSISIPWLTIQGEGDIAWLNSVVNLTFDSNGSPDEVIGRQTIVFKKYDNDWKVLSSHFSFSASENNVAVKQIQQTEASQAEQFNK